MPPPCSLPGQPRGATCGHVAKPDCALGQNGATHLQQSFTVYLATNLLFQKHFSLCCTYRFTNADQRAGIMLPPSVSSTQPTSQAFEVRGLRRLHRGPRAAGGCCGASPQRLSGSSPAASTVGPAGAG